MSEIKYYADQLTSGRISRREFMARALALGATTALATSIASSAVKAAGPNKGGRLRQALTGGATIDVLDPGQLLDTMGINISFGQLRNCLTEIGSDGKLTGELAESWEASDDATQWVFNLRKDVEFHNGKTMDAEDVIDSLNQHRGEESKSAAKGITDPITDIKADGKHKVVFTLSGGSADFPYLMSDYHLSIVPAGTRGADFEKGVGTGAYMLEAWDPGVRALTKRNPNYWKEGRGHFDEVETLGIADANARTAALRTDQIDCFNNVELKTAHLLKKAPGVKVLQTNGTKHFTIPMFTDVAPFDNNDVRLALKYAIDREVMLNTILRGYGVLGNDHPIGEANRYHAAELEQRTYDPDKAKFHLKKAGLDTLTVALSTANTAFEGAVDAAVLYKEQAAPTGINIEVLREPDDGYWSNVWMKKPWCMCYWGGRPTEDWVFSQIYAADASWNDTHWKHDKFNRLLLTARAELDEAKRRAMYVEMQSIVRDEGGAVVPLFSSYVQAYSDKLMLPDQIAANWELDGDKNVERWWFA